MKPHRRACVAILLLGAASGPGAQQEPPGSRSWGDRVPWANLRPQIERGDWQAQRTDPFKIFDNVYYVGVQQVSAYLITTSDGLILLDTTYPETAAFVLDNIRRLGFDPADIKYIFVSHGHGDHFGGAARIQAASGARVGLTSADWDLMERTAQSRGSSYPTVARDLVMLDGATITLGGATLKFYVTPGHTPGCLTIEYTVYDGGEPYRALSLGGLGLGFGPAWTQPYIDSLELMKARDVSVLLPNHPYMGHGHVFDQARALSQRKPLEPHPFVSWRTTQRWFDALLEVAREKLAYEQSGRGTPSGVR